MEIPETVWAEARDIANKIAWSESEYSDAEIIAHAIMAERERAVGEVMKWSGDEPGFNDVIFQISQAIRNPLHKQT